MDFLAFMGAPMVMCLVLVGIHVQLGLHVVRRGVIFVDIALAQTSALGAAVGVLLGVEVGTLFSSVFGVTAALLGAWIIALTRGRSRTVPQEAFIGIAYVVAAAAAMLVLTKVPHGAEETEALLVGSILWVSWSDVLQTAIGYAVLGYLLHRFNDTIRRVTNDAAEAGRAGINLRLWDFIFYAILAFTVTRSVQIAGVFLVFTFLVVPAVMAELLHARRLLLTGWVLGAVISIGGTLLSYWLDLPTGATIVCTFGASLTVLMLLRSGSIRVANRSISRRT
jgi:zinc/manganese transport system permease protein